MKVGVGVAVAVDEAVGVSLAVGVVDVVEAIGEAGRIDEGAVMFARFGSDAKISQADSSTKMIDIKLNRKNGIEYMIGDNWIIIIAIINRDLFVEKHGLAPFPHRIDQVDILATGKRTHRQRLFMNFSPFKQICPECTCQ